MFRLLRIRRVWIKNLWTFLRNAPSFLFFLPAFLEKTPVPSPTMTLAVSSSAHPYARTDTPLRIAHSASLQFLPSPLLVIHWSSVFCAWRKCPFSAFTSEGNKGEIFTRKSLFSSFLQSYGEEVKAKKTKNSGRARYACALGDWGGRQMHFWKRTSGSWSGTAWGGWTWR